MDVGDLWHLALHEEVRPSTSTRKFFVVAPSIGSKPSTGLNAGVSANVAFFRGDPQTTHISSVTGGLKVSEKKQTLGGVRFAMFTQGDQWFVQGNNQLSWTSQNTYGLGGSTLASDATNLKYTLRRFYESVYRNVRPGLFVGIGLDISDHSDIRPGTSTVAAFDASAYTAYNAKYGFAEDQQISSGPSLGVVYDTRDNAINAQRGVLASANYRTFINGFLGGSSTWQELYLDARTYRTLTRGGRNKLAFWFLGDLVTGGTAPYLDLPSTAGQERSARGYSEGRYRGEQLLYGEVEYRGTVTPSGLVGIVAFLNTTTVDNKETGEKLFAAFAPGAGFGGRLLLNKHSKTNLCADYGWGKDGSRGFYLAIQEAF
jgi:outer membrane protein assembly factor BamA